MPRSKGEERRKELSLSNSTIDTTYNKFQDHIRERITQFNAARSKYRRPAINTMSTKHQSLLSQHLSVFLCANYHTVPE